MQPITVSITLCHQFKSDFYNSRKLKSCITSAVQQAEEMNENVNMVFEDIEDELYDNKIHENVIKSIRKSHIIVFELSDVNKNVLYELGIASGIKKPIIVLREQSATEQLPTDINQFIYLTYKKDELEKFTNKLAKSISIAYKSYNELDFVSESLKEKIVKKYIEEKPKFVFDMLQDGGKFKLLKSKKNFKHYFEKVVANCNLNFYYIGTMGHLSDNTKWLDIYKKNFAEGKVFSRIVYLLNLKDFYELYNDVDLTVDYCFWLAQNYLLLKKGYISISFSKDTGIWKDGISIVVADEKELIISTGSFSNNYNNKGIYIENDDIAMLFKEYAKVLSIKSKNISVRGMIKYFSFGEKLTKLPAEIGEVLGSEETEGLRKACMEYVMTNID